MIPTLLDTDTISLLNKQQPIVSTHVTNYITQFGQFCLPHRILPFTHAAAVAAADIWADLKRRGLPIGEIDTLLAGVALSEGLALATHNTNHFSRAAGLTVVDWTV